MSPCRTNRRPGSTEQSMGGKENIKPKDNNEYSFVYYCYLVYVILAIAVIVAIVRIWFDPSLVSDKAHSALPEKEAVMPERGSIYASDGRLLAMSIPKYKFTMDTQVRLEYYRSYSNREEGRALEEKWMKNLDTLCMELSAFIGDKSAETYRNEIRKRRYGKYKDSRDYRLGNIFDYDQRQTIRQFHLFKDGVFVGGLKEDKKTVRQYPFGDLALRTIGFVDDRKLQDEKNVIKSLGIEGDFNDELSGIPGYRWVRKADDSKMRIPDYSKRSKDPENGHDIRTTLDIDIQDIADKALRRQIQAADAGGNRIEGGCVIVMDVHSGALRAMVNLRKGKDGQLRETENYATERAAEPGSVMKAATLMTLLEDKKIGLHETIPTNGGVFGRYEADRYIKNYEKETGRRRISVKRAFEISSNYAFRFLADSFYAAKPADMLGRLSKYHLDSCWSFDLSRFASPVVPDKDRATPAALVSAAVGYSVQETPLHIATFYNAIANKGKMMRPYLVEQTEYRGSVRKKGGMRILEEAVCSMETADSLASAMRGVVTEGTAKTAFRNSPLPVAGKTGTARVALGLNERAHRSNAYLTADGKMKYTATFAGFFPYGDPKYTAVCVIYTNLGTTVYGSGIPAGTVSDIVRGIYVLDESFGPTLGRKDAKKKEKDEI